MRRKKQQLPADEIELAQVFGVLRVAIGVIMFLMPRRAGRTWTGEDAPGVTANLALRGQGARELAIGLGTLAAIERGAPVRGWLEAGVLSDSADAAGTLMQWRELGIPRALFWLTAEVGAAWMGSRLVQSLD